MQSSALIFSGIRRSHGIFQNRLKNLTVFIKDNMKNHPAKHSTVSFRIWFFQYSGYTHHHIGASLMSKFCLPWRGIGHSEQFFPPWLEGISLKLLRIQGRQSWEHWGSPTALSQAEPLWAVNYSCWWILFPFMWQAGFPLCEISGTKNDLNLPPPILENFVYIIRSWRQD